MSQTIVCPTCQAKLVLKRPAVDSTKVKCRSCGAKFYAGKASMVVTESPSAEVAENALGAESQTSVATEVAPPPSKERRRHRSETTKRPKWLIPLGAALLVIAAVMGIVFSPSQHPAPPLPSTELLSQSKPKYPVRDDPPPVSMGTLVTNPDKVRRPDELKGTWELDEPGGGIVDLRANGTAAVKAALYDRTPIEFTWMWFVTSIDGNEYTVEFGNEPHQTLNYRMSVIMQDDGRLKIIRYIHPAGQSFNIRYLKKAEPKAQPAP